MQEQHTSSTTSGITRRQALKGAGAAGVAAVGGTAATGSAAADYEQDGCLFGWPDELGARINIADDEPVETGAVPNSGDLVVFVPGWLNQDTIDAIDINGSHLANTFDDALRDEGFTGESVVAMWDSTTIWTHAKLRSDDAGETLATWLEWNSDAYDSVTLVGHSLGGRVVLEALTHLEWVTVDSVALLGAAVDFDAACEDYEDVIEEKVDREVYNYHTEDDSTVCTIYSIREFNSAIGCGGGDCDGSSWRWWLDEGELPENFVNVDKTGQVLDHCAYVKTQSMDYEGGSCVPDIVEDQLSEYMDIEDSDDGDDGDDNDDSSSCWLFC